MQDINTNVCSSMTLDQQYTLIDSRRNKGEDFKTYTISRLKMNSAGTETACWMTQNLALNLSTNTTLTNQDTDLNTVSSWTPERSTGTWVESQNAPASLLYVNLVEGNYYNWTAAIASNNSSSLTIQYQNAPNSICPKGWRLPMSYNGSQSNMPNEVGNLQPFGQTEFGALPEVKELESFEAIVAEKL